MKNIESAKDRMPSAHSQSVAASEGTLYIVSEDDIVAFRMRTIYTL
jgi:hypothetical protein